MYLPTYLKVNEPFRGAVYVYKSNGEVKLSVKFVTTVFSIFAHAYRANVFDRT